MNVSLSELKHIMSYALGGSAAIEQLAEHDALLGGVAEFDSMAVVSVITALEEEFGITVADDEISAEQFATAGNLLAFLNAKLA